ncbi:uncharacterized protein METZ01_LOCUS365448 [marine metagenome]|uniref:Uncharacterized protein n=1 Tax=marine metagenome TaxID=408172 RepID=A0A382SRP1_9ZZZZ
MAIQIGYIFFKIGWSTWKKSGKIFLFIANCIAFFVFIVKSNAFLKTYWNFR